MFTELAPIPTRRALLGASLVACSPAAPRRDPAESDPAPLLLDDASHRNPTQLARHILLRAEPEATLLATLRAALRDAAAAGQPVAIGAARHSMGGQSLPARGLAISAIATSCEVDSARGRILAGPGTRWRNVIALLDPLGLSPAVMQSNNDFGMAASVSVNAHGWPVPFGPCGSTVHRLRLLLADGTVLDCSRDRNPDLFAAVIGGYGLLGIILAVEADAVPNRLLVPSFDLVPMPEAAARFLALATGGDTAMAYARLNVAASGFLSQALLVGFRSLPSPDAGLPAAGAGGPMLDLARQIYRAQTGSEAGKRVRWHAEARLAPLLPAQPATRNTLLNAPAASLGNPAPGRTDILHEYFLPPAALTAFLRACHAGIPESGQELLNVTLRYVAADDSSLLHYAPAPRIAAVMSFAQRDGAAAEAAMQRLTERLVAAAIDLGGGFYLPYRLHARRDQVGRAYPGLERFVALKRQHDPGLLFRNALWDRWMG